jgi:hypothetical protein
MLSEQQLIFPVECCREQQIEDFKKKLNNLRCGLFKRYEETQRVVERLEKELEEFIQK